MFGFLDEENDSVVDADDGLNNPGPRNEESNQPLNGLFDDLLLDEIFDRLDEGIAHLAGHFF